VPEKSGLRPVHLLGITPSFFTRAAALRAASPAFIPRNHMVEAALNAAVGQHDFQLFEELLDVVSHPYEDKPDFKRYAMPVHPEEYVSQTFCGT
jgi:uncharacterized protein YdiU (UPF0061 family)